MVEPQPRISTIPPGAPFVDALAAELLARHGAEPLALARATVLVPTRRARLALRDAFLRQSGGAALLLPRIAPLGEVDADEAALADEEAFADAEVPPAISELERRFVLTRLVLARGGVEHPDQAVRLAGALARLLDQVETERLGFDALAALVPEDYAEHWQKTLDFLTIVTVHWPGILAERGVVDPAKRRNLLLERLAGRWRAAPPADPVIAAGSTGSIPATADLLDVIARLPAGEVVLPGLDRDADDATWEAIDDSHPQFGLKRLLARLGVEREAVADWPLAEGVAPTHQGRARALLTALNPAATTDAWRDTPPPPEEAFADLERIDCPGAQEEAGVIALRLRAALDEEGRSAALVTRDRALARRVAAELGRWGIEVDDSGGQPLADTAPGSFLRLSAALVAEGVTPLALLAALKHPLAAGGLKPGAFRARVRALERAALRGRRPGEGFEGVARALAGAKQATAPLRRWYAGVAEAAGPFAALTAGERVSLAALVRTHVAFAEWLAESDVESGADRLWRGDAGEAAAAFVGELIDGAGEMPTIAGRDYAALFDSLAEGRVVRPRYGRHPRLHIWGPLEARLQHADLMVLGGLNEGSWPPEAAADPWMSRPMRARFGLPAPERRIGLAAHDFVQCASAPVVLLSRADKLEGAPTVPSRWLARLENLLTGWERADGVAGGARWLGWQAALDRPEKVRPSGRPAPTPPVTARPRELSVTAVETWRRDPYAVYARRILKLKPLDALDEEPGAAERGSLIHKALDAFVREFPGALPGDAYERLLAKGREAFGAALEVPVVRAFWWPRFERNARWFIDTERARRDGLAGLWSEVSGSHEFDGPAGPFTLTAKADRIERNADGTLAIVDYKTGSPPSKTSVVEGLSPQLPLEAVIAAAGGFEGVPAGEVAELAYWHLSSGGDGGAVTAFDDATALAEAAAAGLADLIARFDDPATPYAAIPDPEAAPRFNDYDHLERVKEWSDRDGDEP